MAAQLTRIFSDLHYGDRASRVSQLRQLRPLLDGVDELVLNGDTLDTRAGPAPEHTAACRAEVREFFPRAVSRLHLLTGNHDPDFTANHSLDLAGGEVFAIHGDILLDSIVPWGRDAALVRRLIAAELATLPTTAREDLDSRLAVWRRVAASVPQRHQSERHRLKYALRFLADTVWPPLRGLEIIKVWRAEPARAAALVRRHRPRAKFVLLGHTHRPAITRTPEGIVVINTGSFCPPFGGFAVDLTPHQLIVRRIESRGGEFRAGAVLAEFALAGA